MAELLVREIDRQAGGTGTTAGGTAVVLQQAAALGISTADAVMLDGSGLAPGDRATCLELLDALDLGSQPGFEPIAAGLAVAGQTGTLAARYVGSPIAGKLRAKTGSIDNAGGLVGMLNVTRPLQFAFIDNQPMSDAALLAKEDQVVAALATYPSG
jgi:D-alanyl-D-alanine carboxypeptidase/D-alanyl-D-alanine-endopeptidase (penicillin-binding protein 4)